MTTETKPSEGAASTNEGSQVDVKAIQERLAQLESSNSRLLNESQENKKKANEYKSQLEEHAKKSIDGDTAKQLQYEKEKRAELDNEIKNLKTEKLKNSVRSAVSKYAKDVHDIDDLMNQPQFSHILASGIDAEKGTVDENSAKDYVNKVLETKPWLKKNVQQAGVDTSKPKSVITTKNVDDVKKGEHKDILKGALSQW